jgi:hypothetical protein
MRFFHVQSDCAYRSLCWDGIPEEDLAYAKSFWTEAKTAIAPKIRFRSLKEEKAMDGRIGSQRFQRGGGDCPFYSAAALFFSERAVRVLSPSFSRNGTFTPVGTELGTYYAFKCMTVLNAIDCEKSDIEHFVNGTPRKVNRYVFRENVIGDAHVFRTAWPPPFAIIVSEVVIGDIMRANLEGIAWAELR